MAGGGCDWLRQQSKSATDDALPKTCLVPEKAQWTSQCSWGKNECPFISLVALAWTPVQGGSFPASGWRAARDAT